MARLCDGYDVKGKVWNAWTRAKELWNAIGSPLLALVQAAREEDGGMVAVLQNGFLHHLLALAEANSGKEVAVRVVRGLGSRGS